VVVVVLGRGRWGGDGRGVSIGGRGVWEDGDGEEKQEESCALRAVASRDDRSDAGGVPWNLPGAFSAYRILTSRLKLIVN